MGHGGSKTKSLSQMLEIPWVCSRDQIFIPPQVWGGILESPCPSVCPSVSLSACVMKSCLGHNFKSIKASNFKLHTQVTLWRSAVYKNHNSIPTTVKPQKLKHGNLRTLPKIRSRILVQTKNALDSTSSTSEKSHTVKLKLSNKFHGPECKITFTWKRSNKGFADRLVDKCC